MILSILSWYCRLGVQTRVVLQYMYGQHLLSAVLASLIKDPKTLTHSQPSMYYGEYVEKDRPICDSKILAKSRGFGYMYFIVRRTCTNGYSSRKDQEQHHLLIFHPVCFPTTTQQLGISTNQVHVLYMAHTKLSVQLASAIRYSVCRLPSTKGITRLLCILWAKPLAYYATCIS